MERPLRRLVLSVALLGLAACAGPPEPRMTSRAIYCYRTLADIDCRPEPDPGHESRLVGIWWQPQDRPHE